MSSVCRGERRGGEPVCSRPEEEEEEEEEVVEEGEEEQEAEETEL